MPLHLLKVRNEFYGDTQGALLVFDVGNRDSFEALDYWMREMSNEIGDGEEAGNIVICVCGNKVSQPFIVTTATINMAGFNLALRNGRVLW